MFNPQLLLLNYTNESAAERRMQPFKLPATGETNSVLATDDRKYSAKSLQLAYFYGDECKILCIFYELRLE